MLIQLGTKQHSKCCLTHPTAKLFNHYQLLPLLNGQQPNVIWGATKGGEHQEKKKKKVYAQTGAEMKFLAAVILMRYNLCLCYLLGLLASQHEVALYLKITVIMQWALKYCVLP